MRILFSTTYYLPNLSGLTVYVQRLAEGLAQRGHQVCILTSQQEKTLPLRERMGCVEVERVPIGFRIGKIPYMPSYFSRARELLKQADLLVASYPNSPQEGWLIFSARLTRKPVLLAHVCDVQLPFTALNLLINAASWLEGILCCVTADKIIPTSEDYARHSLLLRHFLPKIEPITPPIEMPYASQALVTEFRTLHAGAGGPVLGFAGRLAAEKGIEYLLEAWTMVRQVHPRAQVWLAGEQNNVIGEDQYRTKIVRLILSLGPDILLMGRLDPTQLAAFYGACDVLVLPSINRTESYGLVQVESMLCGTPVVASDLPGVRVPVKTTGMGKLVSPRDSRRLAEAILEVLENRRHYCRPRKELESRFSSALSVNQLQVLCERVLLKKTPGSRLSKPL